MKSFALCAISSVAALSVKRTLLQSGDPCAAPIWTSDHGQYCAGEAVVGSDNKAYEAFWCNTVDPSLAGSSHTEQNGLAWHDLEVDCTINIDMTLVEDLVSALHLDVFNSPELYGPDCITQGSDIANRCGRDLVGALLRLSFHDSATADATAGTGGADGCFDPILADHVGLEEIRLILESAWTPFQNQVSRADFWVLAESMAVFLAGGPQVPYKMGRRDCPSGVVDDSGFLPSADPDLAVGETLADNMRTFFNRMGLDDRDMVTLLGAHTVGRMEEDNQGFSGSWDSSPHIFNNLYYHQLLHDKWTIVSPPNTEPEHWTRQGTLTLLNVDAALVVEPDTPHPDTPSLPCNQFGGELSGGVLRDDLCAPADNSLRSVVFEFATNETAFFDQFSISFDKMVTAGKFANVLQLVDEVALKGFYNDHAAYAPVCTANTDCDAADFCVQASSAGACKANDFKCVERRLLGQSCVVHANDAPCAFGKAQSACAVGLLCNDGVCTADDCITGYVPWVADPDPDAYRQYSQWYLTGPDRVNYQGVKYEAIKWHRPTQEKNPTFSPWADTHWVSKGSC